MAQLARDGAHSYEVRRLATRITHGIPSKQPLGELLELYRWVRDNIRYRNDPHGLEWVQAPMRTVEERAGDCDDLAVLLASLAQSLGRPVRFETVGHTRDAPEHVYIRAQLPNGEWVTLDPVLEDPQPTTAARRDVGRFGARAIGPHLLFDQDGRELHGVPGMTLPGGTTKRDRQLWQTVPFFPQVAPTSGYADPADAGRTPKANTIYRSAVVPGPTITRPTRSGVMGQLPGVPNVPPEFQQVAQQGAALKQAADEGDITPDQAIGTGLVILAAIPGGAPFAAAGAAAYAVGKGVVALFGDNPSVKSQLFEKLGRPDTLNPAQLRAAINIAERLAMAFGRMSLPAGMGPRINASANEAINAYRTRLIATAAAGVPAYRGARFPDGSIADGRGGILPPPPPSPRSVGLPEMVSTVAPRSAGNRLLHSGALRIVMPPAFRAGTPEAQITHAKTRGRDVLDPNSGTITEWVPVPALGQSMVSPLMAPPAGTPSFTSTPTRSPLFRTGLSIRTPQAVVAPTMTAPAAAALTIAPHTATGLTLQPFDAVVQPKVTAATRLAQAKGRQQDVFDPLEQTITRWVPIAALGAIRPTVSFSLSGPSSPHRHFVDTPRGRVYTSFSGWLPDGLGVSEGLVGNDPRTWGPGMWQPEAARLAAAAVAAVDAFIASRGIAPGRTLPEVAALQEYDARMVRAGTLVVDGLYGTNSQNAAAFYLQRPLSGVPAPKPALRVPLTWTAPGPMEVAYVPPPPPPPPGPVVVPPPPPPEPQQQMLQLVPQDPTVAAQVIAAAVEAAQVAAVPDENGMLRIAEVAPVITPASYTPGPAPVPPYGTPQPQTQTVPSGAVLQPSTPSTRQPRYVPPVDPYAQGGGVIMPEAQPSWLTVPAGGVLPVTPKIPIMPRVSQPITGPPLQLRTPAPGAGGIPWWAWALGFAVASGSIKT